MAQVEICYTVRYYERHGRDIHNPWSLRQTGLYQRVVVATQQASWIILQYSDTVKDAVIEKLERLTRDHSMMRQRQVLLHLAVLTSSLRNWDEYFEYQAAELEKLVRTTISNSRRLKSCSTTLSLTIVGHVGGQGVFSQTRPKGSIRLPSEFRRPTEPSDASVWSHESTHYSTVVT
jgi:hypothetical protein